MATRKKIPLINETANLDVTGTVAIAGSGAAVITFPTASCSFANPGTSGNIMQSNGTNWESGAITNTILPTTTLGYAERTSNFTSTSTSAVDVTSLTMTVTVPAGGRRIKVTVYAQAFNANGTVPKGLQAFILEDGTTISNNNYDIYNTQSGYGIPLTMFASKVPSAGSHTYKVQMLQTTAGTMTMTAGATYPAFILVELI